MERITHQFCPLCNSENIYPEIKLKDHLVTKEEFNIYRCSECEFLFTQNIPPEKHVSKYYESEEYISHSDTRNGLVYKLYHIARKIMLNRKYQLIKKLNTGKKLLDIGCGTGYFLNYMKTKNYDTLGIEMNDKAREYGRKKFNLEILTSEHLTKEGQIERYNIITLWHSLEHLYEPNYYMKVIYNLLKVDGFLIIALPNPNCFDAKYYKSFWAGYDVPRHLWHFTPKTIERMAQNNKFEIIFLKKLPFDPFFNSLLSEKYCNNKVGFPFGIIISLISFLKGLFDIRQASSIIYVMKKTSKIK